MAWEVDIKWGKWGRLEASLRWPNKRGRINFFLVPASMANCSRCPFKHNPICNKWKKDKSVYCMGLCSMLWNMPGDNQFKGRERINGWQPLGPIKRGKKKKDKQLL